MTKIRKKNNCSILIKRLMRKEKHRHHCNIVCIRVIGSEYSRLVVRCEIVQKEFPCYSWYDTIKISCSKGIRTEHSLNFADLHLQFLAFFIRVKYSRTRRHITYKQNYSVRTFHTWFLRLDRRLLSARPRIPLPRSVAVPLLFVCSVGRSG